MQYHTMYFFKLARQQKKMFKEFSLLLVVPHWLDKLVGIWYVPYHQNTLDGAQNTLSHTTAEEMSSKRSRNVMKYPREKNDNR